MSRIPGSAVAPRGDLGGLKLPPWPNPTTAYGQAKRAARNRYLPDMTDTSPRPLAQVPQRASLREVLTVSSRGQITLPAEMRRHMGIEPGGEVIVEDCGGELRLKPAAVLEVELYSDEDIAAWDQADALSDQERQQILKRLRQGRSTPQPRTQSSCWLT